MKEQLDQILRDIQRLRRAMFLSPDEVSGGLWLIEQKLNDAIVMYSQPTGAELQEALDQELLTEDDLPF